jgi:hypothetical protein
VEIVARVYLPKKPSERNTVVEGAQIGYWTVIEIQPHFVKCRCLCGEVRDVKRAYLRNGESKSCGCQRAALISRGRTRHGHNLNRTQSPTYRSWSNLIGRCTNPNNPDYADYGGRGIRVCERWLDFKNFLEDMGEKPSGVSPAGRALWSIDRRDVNGHYEPGNVRWATEEMQARNRRSTMIDEVVSVQARWLVDEGGHRIADVARAFGLNRHTLKSSIQANRARGGVFTKAA